ncbi:AAA-ATPase At5g17760 [Linum grandiflorum]
MPSGSSILSGYFTLSSSLMLAQTTVNHFLPTPAKTYIYSAIRKLFSRSRPSDLTLIIDEIITVLSGNEVFDAAQTYLSTKISPDAKCLKVSKTYGDKLCSITFDDGELIHDNFQDVALQWRFCVSEANQNRAYPADDSELDHIYGKEKVKRHFELTFLKEKKELVLDSYIPYILEQAERIRGKRKSMKLHTLNTTGSYMKTWNSVRMNHPASFDTLAMEPSLKEALIRDLDRFGKRRDFYKRVGRAWKRGYLLHGPPGTGKSSLVAAMANYLKFDVYDLQLASITSDSELRRILTAMGNRSILVIEDIDCSWSVNNVQPHVCITCTTNTCGTKTQVLQITLAGLLNFIDGLWSSCGEERIIVFTTNHKEKLDPALLRPGRMDMHIHMSHCTNEGFKVLANNYLGINGDESHKLFGEIGGLIEEAKVSPAQVAEELMMTEDADVALEGLVNMLKRKRVELEVDSNNKQQQHQEEILENMIDGRGGDDKGTGDHVKRLKVDKPIRSRAIRCSTRKKLVLH